MSTAGSTDIGQRCVVQPYVDIELGKVRFSFEVQASMLSDDAFCL